MIRLLSRVLVLAAIGAAVGYVVQKRKQGDDIWDAEDPDGDWGLAQMDLQRAPTA